jgi:hypothetical protein
MKTLRMQSKTARYQGGQALAEYIYVFPILALLILGAIQFGFIYQTKATLNYATFVATRQGALHNGSMTSIVEGLTAGLMPLFAHSSASSGKRDLNLLKEAWLLADKQVQDPKLTFISIVNPTSTALSSYQAVSEDGSSIPNDNLMYRPTSVTGSAGMSIQDANLLKVRVTYCYKMVVPILNKLIYNLAIDPPGTADKIEVASDLIGSKGGGSTSKRCASSTEYRIPITSEAVVRMQSPFKNPGKWAGP